MIAIACRLLPTVLLFCLAGPVPCQQVADVVFDTLPPEVGREQALAALAQKPGASYDKSALPRDRERLIALLVAQGFLDAEARATTSFITGGVRLTYAVKPRNRYTLDTVRAEGLDDAALAALLSEARIAADTPATQEVVDRLTAAVAPRFGINVLFVDAQWKPASDKKRAVLIMRR
jgi:outer membrane protein assembly factor BamA